MRCRPRSNAARAASFGQRAWRRAKEALSLSETTSARKIEARFRYRRVGKVWRSTETLGEVLERCVEHYGRPPMVAEFDWWRQRELELAAAQGNDAMPLPSPTPYRKRWGTWEQAPQAFGDLAQHVVAAAVAEAVVM